MERYRVGARVFEDLGEAVEYALSVRPAKVELVEEAEPVGCCPACSSADVTDVFVMDGYQEGVYSNDWQWIACRTCHGTSPVKTEAVAA